MSEYEKLVRHRLVDLEMSRSELAERVRAKTGLYCDASYLSRNISGARHAPKILAAINEILGIEGEGHAED